MKARFLFVAMILLVTGILVAALPVTPGVQAQTDDGGITIVLTWQPEGTDVDMHVFDPDNNYTWFHDKQGIPGAELDVDDQQAGGPETFTMPQPRPGRYQVRVNYYEGNVPVEATLRVVVNGTVKFEQTQQLTRSDGNATRGQPQNNPESLWDAYEFVYREVSVVTLSPEESTRLAGQEDCLVATVLDETNQPVEGVQVDFTVTGDNTGTGSVTSGLNGQTTPFCYTGSNPGSDTIAATAGTVTARATKTWINWLFWVLVGLGTLVVLGTILALLRRQSSRVTLATEPEIGAAGPASAPRRVPDQRDPPRSGGGGGVTK
jgi:hypothetical protein